MTVARALALILLASAGACDGDRPPAADTTSTLPTSVSPLVALLPLRALGTEPFWAIDIDTTGLRFITPDDTAGVRFPYNAPNMAGDTSVWTGTDSPSTISVQIWTEKCSDGMSDREYPYAVRVVTGQTVHRGCADRRAAIMPR